MFDTYHALYRNEVSADYVYRAGKYLHHVHLADVDRNPPGAGRVDYFGLIAALKSVGFQGYLTMEIGFNRRAVEPDEFARRAYEHIKPLRNGRKRRRRNRPHGSRGRKTKIRKSPALGQRYGAGWRGCRSGCPLGAAQAQTIVNQWDQFANTGITAAGPAMEELIGICQEEFRTSPWSDRRALDRHSRRLSPRPCPPRKRRTSHTRGRRRRCLRATRALARLLTG